ncbi:MULTISPECIES: thioredoxin domain-containing protein [Sphingobium]|uniref:Protein-disulfide isomerase n=1 Tax=Sphingobium cupriresistens LL01 TaxID=1420583 RepID=A0A0J7XZ46_9SPHN|nr:MULTISPECIES: thioredoxin domain-containing protein [Sphingobium]KMS56839.1 protein-disulfide isomerase [Sphingobium cupriresistens LL01]MBJ7376974.1 thioredoxin domain-containing protein [Sphingobium sp.]
MKAVSALALIAVSLTLAACGKSEEGAKPSGDPVAAVSAPAGTSWSETIAQTPEGYYLMGNPSAKIKLVEYGSYTCSHCKDFSAEASEEIKKIVDTGKMSFEFRTYVRDPIDLTTALLASCGGKDIYYPLSEQFFANQAAMFEKVQGNEAAFQGVEKLPPAQRPGAIAQIAGLVEYAQQRGIAETQAKQCLADTGAAERLAKGVEAANSQYQIQGTPSFLINGVLVDNVANWSSLQPKLKEAGI